jgi:Tol biopolymer transport system component
VSPDGASVVFAAVNRSDLTQLWLRPLDAIEARPIPNTEGASGAFWSPDGQWIGFFSTTNKQLRKTNVSGLQSQVISDQVSALGASWGRDGIIVFGSSAGIHKVAASGGTPVAVTTPAVTDGNHIGPTFLPDGRRFLFVIFGRGLYVGSVDGAAPREVATGMVSLYRLAGEELLTVRGGALVSQHLDMRTLTLTGESTNALAGGVGAFSVSPSVLAYQSQRDGGVHELEWFARSGRPAGALGDRADYSNVELSPDGTHVATAVLDPRARTRDIWIYDVARGIRQRFTFGAGEERTSVWSPDGQRVLFNARSAGVALDFFEKSADGSAREEPVLVDGVSKDAQSWSSDGRYLLYRASGATTANDLWVLPTFGDRKPFPFSVTLFEEPEGRIAPDGRWAAYSSNESGQMEVYVARFPGGGGKARVSTAGGSHPRWRRDGKELFYVSLDNKITAVDIENRLEAPRIGEARALFAVHVPAQAGYLYDVTPDGQRFLVNTDVGVIPPLTVVTNWKPAK